MGGSADLNAVPGCERRLNTSSGLSLPGLGVPFPELRGSLPLEVGSMTARTRYSRAGEERCTDGGKDFWDQPHFNHLPVFLAMTASRKSSKISILLQ